MYVCVCVYIYIYTHTHTHTVVWALKAMRKYRGTVCWHDRNVITIYLSITWENFDFLTLLLVRL